MTFGKVDLPVTRKVVGRARLVTYFAEVTFLDVLEHVTALLLLTDNAPENLMSMVISVDIWFEALVTLG